MKKYSFRLVLRDMIKNQDRFNIEHLTHYCTPRIARGYCEFLSDLEVIVRDGEEGYRTRVSPLYSFGPTPGMVHRRDAQAGICIAGDLWDQPEGNSLGGDYDVIAAWNRRAGLRGSKILSSERGGIERDFNLLLASRRPAAGDRHSL